MLKTANLQDALLRAITCGAVASSDFDLNSDRPDPAGRKLRAAGVLVPILETADGAQLLLTKRSAGMRHHPGQIAFPGGKVDQTDDGPIAAALREAHEEVGLHPSNVEVLGTLAPHETVTGFNVTPVIAFIKSPFTPVPERGEVAEVFSVPLSHATDVSRFQIQTRIWSGMPRYYYTVPYGPYYIWGATARILRALAEGMQR